MKKLLALLLSMIMAVSLAAPAFAASSAGAVTPTPPDWMPAEHYLVFPGDEAYQPENWDKVLELRADAANGGRYDLTNRRDPTGSPAMRYETALVWLKYAENVGGAATDEGKTVLSWVARAFSSAASKWLETNGKQKDTRYYELRLWDSRVRALEASTVERAHQIYVELNALGLTLDDFFDAPYISGASPEIRAQVAQDLEKARERAMRVKLYLDGQSILRTDEVPPEIKDGRTMIPIRALAERLGADVGWDQASKQVTLTRAGVTIIMTVDSKTAYVNGKPVDMDVAPYIKDGRTLIPARYMAEFFGQKVEWDGANRQVDVTEDKSAAGGSNLEAWALPMGAMLAYINRGDYNVFGLYNRSQLTALLSNGEVPLPGSDVEMVLPYVRCRKILSDSWDINSREELIRTVCSMTFRGHNEDFMETAAEIQALPTAQYDQFVASGGVNAYMFPYTRQLSEKWGDRGILCWDLFRMSNLVQWGYVAGYITYPEALALLEPAVVLLSGNFSSWDEAYENYLDGYNWWARNDVLGEDIWKTGRGFIYRLISDSPIFNDDLFKTGVTPVPGLSAQQLLEEALAP